MKSKGIIYSCGPGLRIWLRVRKKSFDSIWRKIYPLINPDLDKESELQSQEIQTMRKMQEELINSQENKSAKLRKIEEENENYERKFNEAKIENRLLNDDLEEYKKVGSNLA